MSDRLTDQDHDRVAPGGLLATGGRNYRGGGIPISLLAGVLPQQVGWPVEDRTGLTGLFDFDRDFSAKGRDVGAAPVAGDPPSISAYWFGDLVPQ
jgi:uncharacterized protein (TIGR03435 family)